MKLPSPSVLSVPSVPLCLLFFCVSSFPACGDDAASAPNDASVDAAPDATPVARPDGSLLAVPGG